ncbi:MAG: hypothetical protein ABIR39_18615 [Nocardioides sp.]|uniref:hypothetical protein n=1 Tax=Nocardioides sp. TaxID=35761 RepID=UPI003263E5E7
MALHPAVLADLLDAEVGRARLKLGDLAGDLHRDGSNIVMTLTRDDGAWNLLLDGSRYDSEPFDATLVDDASEILAVEQWIPGFGLGIHPSLGVPFVCVSGTRGYYAHESHFTERWDTHRFSMRLDSLIESLLRKARIHA